MLRSRIISFVVATSLMVAIFSLPKVVVDNENDSVEKGDEVVESQATKESGSTASSGTILNENHSIEIPNQVKKEIENLRNSYLLAGSQENSIIFADSLATIYRNLQRLDSAAKYLELAKGDNETIGNAYYEAFSFAADVQKAESLALKTREYLQKVLEANPANNSAKIKIAMTYVSSSNPMKGIAMLLEVVEENPNNEEALFNLGILSIQSGQYDKAIVRLEKLLEQNPDNVQAQFYLALSLMNKGQKAKAKNLFQEIKNKSKDEQLLAAVESYLNEL